MALLEADHLSLSINGTRLLKDLSMEFEAGHMYAVVGPNGAGKSTFASTVMGLDG
jgi:Fe-S cluster assembly ATP-binding protein